MINVPKALEALNYEFVSYFNFEKTEMFCSEKIFIWNGI